MKEVLTLGSIDESGRLKIHNRPKFDQAISQLGRGKYTPVIISVKRKYRQRTNPENAYYWGVVVFIARQCLQDVWGQELSDEETHYTLKFYCNAEEHINESTGEIFRVPKSTRTLTTVEFEEYLDRCRAWIEEMFSTPVNLVRVPLPNEQLEFFETN